MRSSALTFTTLALLLGLTLSTIIITDTAPQVYQIAEGETMIVFGEDLETDGPVTNAQQPQKDQTSQSLTEVPIVAEELPQQSSQTNQQSSTQFVSTATRIQSSHYSSYSQRKQVHYVKMFSSFGGLGHRSDEDSYRKIIHESNLKWMDDHSRQQKLTFSMKQNQFSMLTLDEFKQYYLNLVVPDFVPDFELDFKKEIKKFITDDNAFIKKFFDLDLSIDLPTDDFFSFDNNPKNIPSKQQSGQGKGKFQPSQGQQVIPGSEALQPSDQQILPPAGDTSQIVPDPVTPSKVVPDPVTPSNTNLLPDIPSNQGNSIVPNSSSDTTPSSSNSSSTATNSTTSNTSVAPTTNIIPSSIVLDIDWARKGFVSSIKDQGSCGGCYAFTAQATLESAFMMKNSSLYSQIDLSEQQIIDCSKPQGNNGCNGGWMPLVYDYVVKYGITTETAYPYLQAESSCKSSGGSFKISTYQGGALTNCSALSVMVAGRPVAVAVSAGNQYWQNYAGGIMNQCGNGGVDHGVTLVGVYQDNTENYWKVKNSWGPSWGENGYVRLDRSTNNGNICSICSYGFYPEI